MPVGISFENSSMKASFSLSSLPASEQTPDKAVKPRQFNSLTKNRVKATAIRRSWGSTASDHRDEFWSVLQANYNYIMDNQLIDKCQEYDGDLLRTTGIWTLKEFYSQFSELYSWLNSVQETIYGKEENITDKALRAHAVNMVLEKSSSLKLFNDQASQLVQLYPEVQEEVSWRATHLNSKWDSILSILGPSDCDRCDQDFCLDIDHELKCLRQWFKVMESRLQPLDFRAKYTKTEIETKALELNVLHRDIESHGKIVGSVVKLCKRTDAKCNTINARRIANGLERRWHLLFLRSLEWQCYLESLSKKQSLRNSASSSEEDSDSDCYREPANKYPRLSGKECINRTTRWQQSNDYTSSEDESADSMHENGMTDNTSRDVCPKDIDVTDGSIKVATTEDNSNFTKTDKKAPNLATFYFRHEDTDSDMDKIEQHCNNLRVDGQSTLEETSEEEWTYTKSNENETKINNEQQQQLTTCDEYQEIHHVPKPKPIPEEKIRRLVQKAEELVSPDKLRKNSLNKLARVNKWLSLDKPDDSCDASGEEDEKESQTSEDFDASTMTLREAQCSNSQNTSFDELNASNTNKLWYGSSVCQLNEIANTKVINNFSISESAIHKMNFSPKVLDRFTTVSSSNFTSNNSTSSTIEEISPLATEKTSPVRRKKSKLKKKNMFGKSDTHLLCSPSQQKTTRNVLIKSDSFSGYSTRFTNNDRHSCSDPPIERNGGGVLFCETPTTTSGADSDEEYNRRVASYKYGLKLRHLHGSEIRDDSPGKNSLNAAEEQSSSLSEQAWDNYQENYLSEAYSESHDSDAAKRLLNFGEDYSKFIDSQSDWSAFSDMSPTFKRKSWGIVAAQNGNHNDDDSDNNEESLKQLISDSREQLFYAEKLFNQMKTMDHQLMTNELDDLVKNCDRYISLMSQMNESSDEIKMTISDKAITTGLLGKWKILRMRATKMLDYRTLQKQIMELKLFITSVKMPENRHVQHVPVDDMNNEIDACNILLEAINNQSAKLASLNALVHRFTLENQNSEDFGDSNLKADISELYGLFDDARTSTSDKLSQIESLLPAWKTLEARLDQLQKDLREDEKTIQLLDICLTNGTFNGQTASSVRDVAKVLSETTVHQGYNSLQEILTEGSFSDSGISDEGSEHEIGERQGRLSAIRRLVRQLEVSLSPNSKTRQLMREKLNKAEEELKILQQRCKSLIVKTAACTAASPERLCQLALQSQVATTQDQQQKPKKKMEEQMIMKAVVKTRDNGGEPDDDPDDPVERGSFFKRMFKASVAFQLVILTFVCLSCLYEPQCCDYMNNYSWSISPKLHYEGRPPI